MDGTLSERRLQPGQRHAALTLLGTLRWYGRQQAYRRINKASHAYLDRLSPRIVLLVGFVLTCSALDALFTLLHIQHGGSEANPVMALVLEQGMTAFVWLKMGLTGIGAVVLAVYQHVWLGIWGLYLLSLVYAGLLGYHAVILLSRV